LIQSGNTAVIDTAVLLENADAKQSVLHRQNRVAGSGTAGV
jgi:hypothetical protein